MEKLMVCTTETNTVIPTSIAKETQRDRLVAQWLIIDNRLVCQWVITKA
jgi:hypothetical protein